MASASDIESFRSITGLTQDDALNWLKVSQFFSLRTVADHGECEGSMMERAH